MSQAPGEVTVEALGGVPVAERRVEVVERKGIGHPDSLCDALVETVAVALHRLYVERTGGALHYNVDKGLLVAGGCRRGFGWGKVTRPMELIVGDRATLEVDGVPLPVEETVATAVQGWLAAHMPRVRFGEDFRLRSALGPSSAALRGVLGGPGGDVSNDTSVASGYAPMTPTESLVLGVERFLNGAAFKDEFPDTGQDVKVFAARRDERVAITVAMPLLAAATPSEAAYFRRKDEILDALARRFAGTPLELEWGLNRLDRPGGGAESVYLTVCGTSAEDADSGQVGRGNRANGLIALARPTGGEAAAGKNAIAHVGKIYSVFGHHLAGRLHARCPELVEVYVHLAARIGDPVDEPWAAVQVVLPPHLGLDDVRPAIAEVVEEERAGLPAFRQALARGEHPVC